eukprot:COSAG04_NODE_29957_length_265_cov_1.216867_1_plen_31_part_10
MGIRRPVRMVFLAMVATRLASVSAQSTNCWL